MEIEEYLKLKALVIDKGYRKELAWSVNIKPCENPSLFANEAMWVILNSGMKNQIARKIEEKIWHAINFEQPISSAFGHEGKVRAIEYILGNKERLFNEYQKAEDKVEYLETLPWIGPITKYHLAKNLGIDTCKPDRHLLRIAAQYDTDPFTFCEDLARKTGDKIAVVDSVLWRAANLGII